MADRPRIFIEILGGNVQRIVSDQEVDVVLVDYDNALDEDDPLKADAIEGILEAQLQQGSAVDFDQALSGARDALEDIASKNSGPKRV